MAQVLSRSDHSRFRRIHPTAPGEILRRFGNSRRRSSRQRYLETRDEVAAVRFVDRLCRPFIFSPVVACQRGRGFMVKHVPSPSLRFATASVDGADCLGLAKAGKWQELREAAESQLTLNQRVAGSSPAAPTRLINSLEGD